MWNSGIVGVADNVIVEYNLNAAGDQLVGEKIIDKDNAHFHDPTTAVLHNDALYVISNSCLTPYNNNQESVEGIDAQLGSVVILVYALQRAEK